MTVIIIVDTTLVLYGSVKASTESIQGDIHPAMPSGSVRGLAGINNNIGTNIIANNDIKTQMEHIFFMTSFYLVFI